MHGCVVMLEHWSLLCLSVRKFSVKSDCWSYGVLLYGMPW
jgi:hypothetical protein